MSLRQVTAKLNCRREFLLFQEGKTVSLFLLDDFSPYVEITLDFKPSSLDFFQDILVLAEEEKIKFYVKERNSLYYSNSFSIDKPIGALSFLSASKVLLLSFQEIFVYDWHSSRLLATYFSRSNPKFIYTLSKNSFAFPAEEKGKVIVRKNEETLLLTVSKREVAALAMNYEGDLLASASSKGTVVKVWNMKGECLHSCRRGSSPASIFSLSLEKKLALSSDHETVHLFNLEEKGTLANLASYFSYSLSDYLQTTSSFLQISSSPCSFVFLWRDKVFLVNREGEYLEYSMEGKKEKVLFYKERS